MSVFPGDRDNRSLEHVSAVRQMRAAVLAATESVEDAAFRRLHRTRPGEGSPGHSREWN